MDVLDLRTDETLSSDSESEAQRDSFSRFVSSLPPIQSWQARRVVTLIKSVDDTNMMYFFNEVSRRLVLRPICD